MGDEGLRESHREAQKLEEEIRRRVKRFQPRKFGPVLAGTMIRVLENQRLFRAFPPHYVAHAIEANCAYHISHFDDEVTERAITRLSRAYANYNEPYVMYALSVEENLDLALMAMAEQQFPFQERLNLWELPRYLTLFVLDDPIPETNELLLREHGWSARDWFYMSFAVVAFASSQGKRILTADTFLTSEVSTIPEDAVEPFLKASSLGVKEIGERYLIAREEVRHICTCLSSQYSLTVH